MEYQALTLAGNGVVQCGKLFGILLLEEKGITRKG